MSTAALTDTASGASAPGASASGASSNMFAEVLADAKGAEEKYMGPDYPYYKYIRTPAEMGMSGKGSLSQLGKDVNGLVSYVKLLVSGGGAASATGRPLGNKFFLETGGKCVDAETKEEVARHIYIDNVPEGNIPLISGAMGVNFSEFKGLIPGTISNLNAFNPMTMFQSFLSGSKPDCRPITMETIDIHNNRSTETNYVTLVDIQNMDPCTFPDRTNPVTGAKCRETFVSSGRSGGSSGSSGTTGEGGGRGDEMSLLCAASLGVVAAVVAFRVLDKWGGIPSLSRK